MTTFKQFLEAKKTKIPSLKWELENYYKDQETDYIKDKEWIDEFNQKPNYKQSEIIYNNYKKYLERKRPETALPYYNFIDYIQNDEIKSFKFGDSYMFGSFVNGIFFPSHFAPHSLKEAMHLLIQLQKYDVVLFVPEDLSKQAEKLGFIKIASNIPAIFRDTIVEKNILVSNINLIPKLKKMQHQYHTNQIPKFFPTIS